MIVLQANEDWSEITINHNNKESNEPRNRITPGHPFLSDQTEPYQFLIHNVNGKIQLTRLNTTNGAILRSELPIAFNPDQTVEAFTSDTSTWPTVFREQIPIQITRSNAPAAA